jgi:hypothetical protein
MKARWPMRVSPRDRGRRITPALLGGPSAAERVDSTFTDDTRWGDATHLVNTALLGDLTPVGLFFVHPP